MTIVSVYNSLKKTILCRTRNKEIKSLNTSHSIFCFIDHGTEHFFNLYLLKITHVKQKCRIFNRTQKLFHNCLA